MVALQIRDVPDDVRDRLAELARSRGQSLQAYLLALVTRQAWPNRPSSVSAPARTDASMTITLSRR